MQADKTDKTNLEPHDGTFVGSVSEGGPHIQNSFVGSGEMNVENPPPPPLSYNKWMAKFRQNTQGGSTDKTDKTPASTENSQNTGTPSTDKTDETPDLLEASMRRLEDMMVSVSVCDDGSMRIVTDATSAEAVRAGGVAYTPEDMWHYVQLDQRERRLLHSFKKQFGGTMEWKNETTNKSLASQSEADEQRSASDIQSKGVDH
jgi:hypothetical protein